MIKDGVKNEKIENLESDLLRKDEELRKIQKSMSSWKQSQTKKISQKFESELKKITQRASQISIDSESGFVSIK